MSSYGKGSRSGVAGAYMGWQGTLLSFTCGVKMVRMGRVGWRKRMMRRRKMDRVLFDIQLHLVLQGYVFSNIFLKMFFLFLLNIIKRRKR